MDVRVRLWRKLNTEELMLLNCGVGEDSWESLGLQGDPKGDQSILKEISPGCSLELKLKLKLQYFGHLMQRVDSLEDSDAGRDWGQEEKGTTEDEMTGWHHWLDGREFEWTLGVGDRQRGLACCAIHGVVQSRTQLSDWTELNWNCSLSGVHRFMFITLRTLEGNKNKIEKIRRQKVLVQAFASNGCTVLGKPFNTSEHEDSLCEGEKDYFFCT